MSTLKSDGIQPTLNTNNLIIRSGADVERLRIQPDGQILVASTTGTTFAGEVNFSNTVRLPGGVQVGGGIGPTRFTALDVVHTNAGLGLPDAVNYNTTRSRSNMMVRASGTNTTLFFGNNSSTHAWLQVQNSDNNPYGLMLNPAGGEVSLGGNFKIGDAVMSTPSGSAPLFGIRAWVTFCGILDINGNDDSSNQGNYNAVTSYPAGHSPNRKIIASGNVSSVTLTRDPRDLTKYATGVYTVNFTTPLPSSSTNFRTSPSYNRTPVTPWGAAIPDATLYSDSRSPYYQKNGTPLGAYAVAGFSNEMYGNLWYGTFNYFTAGGFWDWNACLPDKCIVNYNNEDTLGACIPGNATLIFVG